MHEIVDVILKDKLIAIIRADTGGDDLISVIRALHAGGIRCVEVTMTTPDALTCVTQARRQVSSGLLLGVGTVLDSETCRAAILAGADYIVTPTLSPDVIAMGRRYGKPVISGAYTPTEILRAWECGADLVKVFPAIAGGPEYIKAVRGPLPQIPLVPTGGVELSNIAAYIEAGASAVAIGGNLISRTAVASRDFAAIEASARMYKDAVSLVCN